jgi:hypothetical protein
MYNSSLGIHLISCSFLYMRSFVADGNFKANHLKQKNDSSDVWLTHGEAHMTGLAQYSMHLDVALETKGVRRL